MSLSRSYMDYNATAPLSAPARQAMLAALDLPGNASSVHSEGRAVRALIEKARGEVAALVGVPPAQVTFTAGGTEAANTVLTPYVSVRGDSRPFDWLLVAAGEHLCVLQGHRFPADRVRFVPLTADGVLDLAALERELDSLGAARVMLALQAANNETGVLQPVREAAQMMQAHNGILVCDAVQAAGRIDISAAALGADIIFASAHKLGGPKGVGMLAFAAASTHISPALVRGGGQERGLRAGTENIAAIAGFGAAVVSALADRDAQMASFGQWRDRLECGLTAMFPDLVVFGAAASRLGNTSAFALADAPAETLLIALDLEGFAVSSGSACSSGKVQPSHVLAAMGVTEDLAKGALRVSLGPGNTIDDVDRFVAAFGKVANGIRARRKRAA